MDDGIFFRGNYSRILVQIGEWLLSKWMETDYVHQKIMYLMYIDSSRCADVQIVPKFLHVVDDLHGPAACLV